MFKSRKERKIRKVEDNLDDARAYLDTWGFAMKPSDIRRLEEKIFDLEQQHIDLTGEERR